MISTLPAHHNVIARGQSTIVSGSYVAFRSIVCSIRLPGSTTSQPSGTADRNRTGALRLERVVRDPSTLNGGTQSPGSSPNVTRSIWSEKTDLTRAIGDTWWSHGFYSVAERSVGDCSRDIQRATESSSTGCNRIVLAQDPVGQMFDFNGVKPQATR
jgi:hypothetical protein